MRSPQVSVALQGDKPYDAYEELGTLAEAFGFDGVSVYADLGFQPAIVPLLAIARVTKRVRLGPAGLNPYLLHPVEIAGQIAALDAASNGRAYLGLVRGAWLDDIGVSDAAPLTRMREAVAVIQRLLAGDASGFAGECYRLPAHRLFQYAVNRAEIPLLIGTWGPKLTAFAGECAHEIKLGGSTNPALAAVVRAQLSAGERIAGRSDGSTGIVFGAVTVCDEDGHAARAFARRQVARYLPVVAPLDPSVSIDPALLSRIAALVDAGDDAAAGDLVPDDTLDRFAFSGTPVQIAAQAERLFAAGASRVEFGTPHGLDPARGLRLLGEQTLPRLR